MIHGSLQFTFALWTRAMVCELICREFAVRLSEGSVGRLLGKLGLSPQRPLDRASQQNPEAVARWKAETYPSSVGRPRRWGQDRLRRRGRGALGRPRGHDLGTGRADPRGRRDRRPVRDQPDRSGGRQGHAALAAYDGSWNGSVFIDCCRRLLDDSPGPVFLVLDGHPVDRSKAVKAFAASTNGGCSCASCPGMRRS
jgi:Winged helix-turn helix